MRALLLIAVLAAACGPRTRAECEKACHERGAQMEFFTFFPGEFDSYLCYCTTG